jgi:hemerythrin
MAFMTWDDSYSVGVCEIDGQHAKLIGYVNELHEAMSQGKGRDVLKGVIDGLAEYTMTHFGTEEKYFAEFDYPDAEAHKQEHWEFLKRVAEFKIGYDEGRHGVSIEVMMFLRDWVQKHIKGSDKKYGPFFNAKGLK